MSDPAASSIQQALALFGQGDRVGALSLIERAAARFPEHSEVLKVVGQLRLETHRFDSALEALLVADAMAPNRADILEPLSLAFDSVGRFVEAEMTARRGLSADPGHLGCKLNLSLALIHQDRLDEAEIWARDAHEQRPESVVAINNLYMCLRARDPLEAWRWLWQFDHAATLRLAAAESLYLSELTNGQVLAAHEGAAEFLCLGVNPTRRYIRALSLERPIKIGFLGGDFRHHAVSSFLLGWIPFLDRSRFEVEFFALNPRKDSTTDQFLAYGVYHDLSITPTARVVSAIYSAGVDVLIDLGGYTGSGRPEVLASRPAPLQVSAIGYAHETHLPTVIARLTDETTDPGREDFRLNPCFLNFSMLEKLPAISARTDGPVVFGSFNNAQKLSKHCITLWARAVNSVENARLVLKSLEFSQSSVRERIEREFRAAGVQNLSLLPPSPSYHEHLAAYAQLDVALDTTPYSGTTTTIEALLMGVPVVSLMGPSHRSRVSASILQTCGFKDWVAKDESEFVEKAKAVSGSVSRESIRDKVLSAPICDGPQYAEQFSEAIVRLVKSQSSA